MISAKLTLDELLELHEYHTRKVRTARGTDKKRVHRNRISYLEDCIARGRVSGVDAKLHAYRGADENGKPIPVAAAH